MHAKQLAQEVTPLIKKRVVIDRAEVIAVLPLFPYSRQPDVPYVRPDTPLANAPAMLFKDSFTVPSGPTTPVISSQSNSEKWPSTQAKRGPIENNACVIDKITAPGGSGSVVSIPDRITFR